MNRTIIVVVIVGVLVIALPLVARLLRGRDTGSETLPPSNSAQSALTTTGEPADGPLATVTVNLQGTEVSCTALGAAVWKGDKQRVKEFLDAGVDIDAPLVVRIPGTPEYSTYAICIAVEAVAMQEAQRDLIEFLLNNGADVNVSYQRRYASSSGVGPASTETPVILAISAGRADIVELLLEHGADPNAPLDRPGMTLLKLATGMRQPDVADVLRRHGAR